MNQSNIQFLGKEILTHSTPTRTLVLEKYTKIIDIQLVKTDKATFTDLCKRGCVNYSKKFSCPPFSPTFQAFSANAKQILIICYRASLNQYSDLSSYNRVRASNSVLKSVLDKELLMYKDTDLKVVGSGSCRACKPCGAKVELKCKKPNKKIYSLESLGVDVNQLVRDCFNFSLEWYRTGQKQDYTCVVGGVLLNN